MYKIILISLFSVNLSICQEIYPYISPGFTLSFNENKSGLSLKNINFSLFNILLKWIKPKKTEYSLLSKLLIGLLNIFLTLKAIIPMDSKTQIIDCFVSILNDFD